MLSALLNKAFPSFQPTFIFTELIFSFAEAD